MINTAQDFENVRIDLSNGIDHEILALKHFMESIDENTFGDDPETTAAICERIFYTAKGLEKLADVLSFVDCWEENGEPPQLSRDARFEVKENGLKDWQKEIMFREGNLY